ncbi:hypothetical protein BH10ACT7_BH10ACT7_09570 [soil metagenome]
MSRLVAIGGGLDHPEGVAYSDSLGLFAGGEAGQIYRIDPDSGAHEIIAETGGYVLGMAFGPDGRLYACDMGRSAVLAIDTSTGAVEDVTSGRGPTLAVPNHLVFANDGSLFVSDSGSWPGPAGRVVRYAPDGEGRVVDESAGGFTNGLAIDPTGEWLYVVETSVPAISRLRIVGEELHGAERVVEMARTVPDGIAFAADGTLVISCYRPDAVYTFTEASGLQVLAEDWTGLVLSAPTNVVFAGPARDRLITANLANQHLVEVLDTGLVGAPLEFTRA